MERDKCNVNVDARAKNNILCKYILLCTAPFAFVHASIFFCSYIMLKKCNVNTSETMLSSYNVMMAKYIFVLLSKNYYS